MKPPLSPLHVLRQFATFAACLSTSLSADAYAAPTYAVRTIPKVVWAEEAHARFKKIMEREEAISGYESALREAVDAVARRTFPEAYEAGDARTDGSTMERQSKDLMHVGMSLSRVELNKATYGSDKTTWTAYVTGTLFAVNLGTGEILGARSKTIIVPQDFRGRKDALTTDEAAGLFKLTVTPLSDELSAEFFPTLTPGVIEAEVCDSYRDGWVIAQGRLEGAYVGEVLSDDEKHNFRVSLVSEHASLVKPTKSGVSLKAGDHVRRFGTIAQSGNVPRLMVASAIRPQVADAEAASLGLPYWLSDALASAGFVVIPPGTELLAAQMEESGIVNIAYDALVGAQAVPDIIVVPVIRTLRVANTFDEETRSTTMDYVATVQANFIDVKTGMVLFSTTGTQERSDYTQEGGRQVAVSDRYQALLKDASLNLAAKTKDTFKPVIRTTSVSDATGSHIGWDLAQGGYGLGTMVEIVNRTPDFKTADGITVGGLDLLVGVARVEKVDGQTEKAAVVAKSDGLDKGARVRAVSGGAATDARVVTLGTVKAETALPAGLDAAKSIQNGMFLSDKFHASIDGDVLSSIERARKEMLEGGAFSLEAEKAIKELKPATHRLDISVSVEAPPTQKEEGKKKTTLTRTLNVKVVGTLFDIATGERVRLITAKGEEKESSWAATKKTLKASVRPNEYAPLFADTDTAGLVDDMLTQATSDLLGYLRANSDRAAAAK